MTNEIQQNVHQKSKDSLKTESDDNSNIDSQKGEEMNQ